MEYPFKVNVPCPNCSQLQSYKRFKPVFGHRNVFFVKCLETMCGEFFIVDKNANYINDENIIKELIKGYTDLQSSRN
ncbi:MAG: hypothetical protein ACOYEB_00645 [Enterococcus lemanii]|jgi:hypothetical protein